MPPRPHLSHAPITEAIVDFRVKAAADFAVSSFEGVQGRLGDYPQMTPMREHATSVRLDAAAGQATQHTESRMRGLRFSTEDGLDVAQFRIDGFTFNRLAPYTAWEEIRPKALRGWNLYRETARPEMVTRLALRYINQMTLPRGMGDFDEVMTGPPPVPAQLPQSLSRFLTRVTVHAQDTGAAAHITQTLGVDSTMSEPKLILDIDCFMESDVDPASDQVVETLELLRDLKNDIFFESLTDEYLKRFE